MVQNPAYERRSYFKGDTAAHFFEEQACRYWS